MLYSMYTMVRNEWVRHHIVTENFAQFCQIIKFDTGSTHTPILFINLKLPDDREQ